MNFYEHGSFKFAIKFIFHNLKIPDIISGLPNLTIYQKIIKKRPIFSYKMLKEGQCHNDLISTQSAQQHLYRVHGQKYFISSIDLKNDNFQKLTDITQQGQALLNCYSRYNFFVLEFLLERSRKKYNA